MFLHLMKWRSEMRTRQQLRIVTDICHDLLCLVLSQSSTQHLRQAPIHSELVWGQRTLPAQALQTNRVGIKLAKSAGSPAGSMTWMPEEYKKLTRDTIEWTFRFLVSFTDQRLRACDVKRESWARSPRHPSLWPAWKINCSGVVTICVVLGELRGIQQNVMSGGLGWHSCVLEVRVKYRMPPYRRTFIPFR